MNWNRSPAAMCHWISENGGNGQNALKQGNHPVGEVLTAMEGPVAWVICNETEDHPVVCWDDDGVATAHTRSIVSRVLRRTIQGALTASV